MEILKKLTLRALGLDSDTLLRACIDKEGITVPVARLFGRAVWPSESKMGDNGPYTLFKGMFGGVNLLTGEQAKSGLAIFNGAAESMLAGLVSMAAPQEEGGAPGEVPFVYEIGVKYDASAIAKYVFSCKVIGEEKLQLADPLAEVRAIAMGDVPTPALENSGKKGSKKG
jgi:hypothetical protein